METQAWLRHAARGVAWKLTVAPVVALIGASVLVHRGAPVPPSTALWTVPLVAALVTWVAPRSWSAWLGALSCGALLLWRGVDMHGLFGWAGSADILLLAMPTVAAIGGCVELSRRLEAARWHLPVEPAGL